MEQFENEEIPENGTKFKIHRSCIMFFSLMLYTMVFFHRNSPSSMIYDLINYFQVSKSDLSLISSMFMWSSALIQLIVAPLSDLFEPYYLLTIFTLTSVFGCLMCGLSTNFSVFVAGRFFTGIGVGPTYLAISKFTMGWFNSTKYLAVLTGITLGIGGMGTFLSSFPLVMLENKLGWRWVFHISAIFSGILIVILFFIGRADPTCFGYYKVKGSKTSKKFSHNISEISTSNPTITINNLNEQLNNNSINELDDLSVDSKVTKPVITAATHRQSNFKIILVSTFKQVWINICFISKKWNYIVLCVVNMIHAGLSMQFQSYWASSWLTDVKEYSSVKSSNICIAFTIGQILPPLIVPHIANRVGHRRMGQIQLFLYFVMTLVFAIFNRSLPAAVIFILLFLNTATMFIIQPSMTMIVVAEVGGEASATGLGLFNVCAFVGASVTQMISASILKNEKTISGKENVYSWKSYNNAVFYPTIAFIAAANFIYFFSKDPFDSTKNNDCDNNNDSNGCEKFNELGTKKENNNVKVSGNDEDDERDNKEGNNGIKKLLGVDFGKRKKTAKRLNDFDAHPMSHLDGDDSDHGERNMNREENIDEL